jgi:lactaldehyde dehydrogenase/glycolaldehyde dehydrogenase
MRKEIFGPVLLIQAIDDLEEGIALANDSEYGLTSLFTANLKPQWRRRANCVCETFVNRNNFEDMQGFHVDRKHLMGGKHVQIASAQVSSDSSA